MACDGYLQAKKKWERRADTGSAAATTGQNVHEAMTYVIDGQPVDMDQTQREAYLTEELARMKQELSTVLMEGKEPLHRRTEKRLFIHDKSAANKEIATVKPDVFEIYEGGIWLVADYKTGPDPVSTVEQNWQLATAAAALSEEEQLIIDNDMRHVYGVILQPLVTKKPAVVIMDVDEVRELRQRILRRLREVNRTTDLPRYPGNHCKWCPVGHLCLEGQSVGAVVSKQTGNLTHMSPQQLVELHKIVPMIRAKCDEIVDFIKQKLAEDPDSVPGLTIRETGGGHDIVNNTEMLKFLKTIIEISPQEFWGMAEVPVTKLRNVWIEKYSGMKECTKKDAGEVFDKLFKSESSTYLAARPKRRLIVPSDGKPKIEQKTPF